MKRITVTFTIDIPDNAVIATPDVEYGSPDEPPLPEPPIDLVAEAVRTFQAEAPHCPVHVTAMVLRPAGISRKGKPYPAFWSCTVRECRETRNAA